MILHKNKKNSNYGEKSAALKYYPTILLPAISMGFALLNANILLADRSTNTIVKNYYVLKYVFIQIIVYGLWKEITTSFWTPGLPDGVHGNRPCPSVSPSVRPLVR